MVMGFPCSDAEVGLVLFVKPSLGLGNRDGAVGFHGVVVILQPGRGRLFKVTAIAAAV